MVSAVVFIKCYICCFKGKLSPLRHGIPRINREVHKYLFNLTGICKYFTLFCSRDGFKLYIFTYEAFKESLHLFKHRVEVHSFRFNNLFTGECQYPLCEVSCAFRGFFYCLKIMVTGVLSSPPHQAYFNITHNCSEKVIEIMGNTPGQSPHSLHLLRLCKLLFHRLLLFFSPYPLCYINSHADKVGLTCYCNDFCRITHGKYISMP